ncbi:MAG: hypothetical protein Q9201_006476 [Fulgogasparrea decipioides]
MASRQNALSAQRKPRASKTRDQGTLRSLVYSVAVRSEPLTGKRPRSVENEQPRRSASLEGISRLPQRSHDRKLEQTSPSPPAGKVPEGRIILHQPSKFHQKRKREQEAGHSSPQDQDRPPSKRPRTWPPSCRAGVELEAKAESDTSKNNPDPIEAWIQTTRWPSQYFEQDSQAGEDFFQHDNWLEELMEQSSIPVVQYVEINGMKYPRPVQKGPTSLRRKASDSSLTGCSDQLPREVKSAQYRTEKYSTILATKGSFMDNSDFGITTSSKSICQDLLQTEQTVPQDSLFRDDLFDKTCRNLQNRNEAMVIRDIALLIVPSAQTLATYGATHLNHLFECVNEGWNAAIPFHGTRPQPDYSVGFDRSAFTEQQLKKLEPLVGDILYNSKLTTFFMATYRMYFPFLTCEVKCGASALDIADRQNAHSITVAVRGVVELYKAVKREKELHREILAFSISHDHRAVRMYGHYPIIEGDKTTFYRYPIHMFDFTALDGKERWTAYRFTKNVYDTWMPKLHKLICSAIDDLPAGINFDLSQSASFSQSVPQSSQQSNAESTLGEDDSHFSFLASQEVTPPTSLTQATEPAFKKPKNPGAGGQQR